MTKLALVTGGAKRIGRAICLKLASQGYGVVIHYWSSEDEASKTRDDCLAAGAAFATTVRADLHNPDDRLILVDKATTLAGPISLLVNNASTFAYDEAATFSAQRFDDHLQTNYFAPIELTMAMHRLALNDHRTAHVVTLLDQKVFNLNTDYMTYTLAKLASQSSIRYLAQCCAPALRVNALAPGVSLISGNMDSEEFNKAHKVAALGRSSTPEDVAAAVLMLDGAPAITGQILAVDGGQHLIPRARDVGFEI